MSRYNDRYAPAEYDQAASPDYGFVDSRVDPRSMSGLAPGYNDYGRDASRTSLTLVRPSGHHPPHHHERDRSPAQSVASTVIQEPVIEHEHHHLHHHIDHGMFFLSTDIKIHGLTCRLQAISPHNNLS
jgi:hypothetical protein